MIIAGATPGWTRIIYEDPTGTAEDGLVASFGLFRGEHEIDSGFSDISRGDDFQVGKYNDSILCCINMTCSVSTCEGDYLGDDLPVWRLDLTFALIVVSFAMCIPAMGVTFLSTYQTVTTIWKGPAVAYLLHVVAGN